MSQNKKWFWIACIFLLALGFVLSLFIGSVDIPLSRIFQPSLLDDFQSMILLESRLPRAITAIIGGAGLSVAGLMMQTLFRNPLAGPSVLGISSGASLAVAFITLGFFGIQLNTAATVIAAIVGSFSVLVIIMWVARKFTDITTVLIVGLMLSFFASSIVSLLQSFASDSNIKAFVFWGFGSFSDISLKDIPLFAIPILAVLALSPFLIKGLNAFLMGELHAKSMGFNPKRFQLKTILAAGTVAGVVTAFCGPIAFIGLASPHIARMVFKTSDHRIILPTAILFGAILALYCDMIARLPGSPMAIPLNTVCSFMGAPVVIYLIVKGRKQRLLL